MTLQAKRIDFAVMFSTVSFYQTRSTNKILSKISFKTSKKTLFFMIAIIAFYDSYH